MTLKRLAAPNFWKIEKKTKKFVVKPMPGPHDSRSSIPIGVVIRDILKYAYTMKEVHTILNNRVVKVDDRVVTKNGFPVGLMDIVNVGDDVYRVIPGMRGLTMIKIEKHEAKTKLVRIENKVYVRKGRVQLNLHDGKNMIAQNDGYKTNDVLVFDIENKSIKDVIKFEKGSNALIIKGNNIGSIVMIKDTIITKSSMPNQAVVSVDGRDFTLPVSYLFAIGKGEPVISLKEKHAEVSKGHAKTSVKKR